LKPVLGQECIDQLASIGRAGLTPLLLAPQEQRQLALAQEDSPATALSSDRTPVRL
jgi:hypothetical protein